jgi:hypothetical protein
MKILNLIFQTHFDNEMNGWLLENYIVFFIQKNIY